MGRAIRLKMRTPGLTVEISSGPFSVVEIVQNFYASNSQLDRPRRPFVVSKQQLEITA